MSTKYALSKAQLEKIAEQIKVATVMSLESEGLLSRENAIKWTDNHKIIFELAVEKGSTDEFGIKVVKIVVG